MLTRLTTASQHELRFADLDALGMAHHTTHLHLADCNRLEFIRQYKYPAPAPITALTVTYADPITADIRCIHAQGHYTLRYGTSGTLTSQIRLWSPPEAGSGPGAANRQHGLIQATHHLPAYGPMLDRIVATFTEHATENAPLDLTTY